MGKYSCLCLPKQETATRSYACVKLFLLTVFATCFVYEVILTVVFIKEYRDRVQDLKVSSVFPSRSEIQVESSHAHFFLFTGLMNAAAVMCGFWAVLMEYLIALAAYVYVHGFIIVFEAMGAWRSNDAGVAARKGAALLPEPFLVIFALIFAHMVRVAEKELASSPLYKKKMAERAGKGETMCDPDYQLASDRNDNHLKSVTVIGGQVNPALVREETTSVHDDSSSGNSSRSQSVSSAASHDVTVLTSDGRTRISINSAPQDTVSADPMTPASCGHGGEDGKFFFFA